MEYWNDLDAATKVISLALEIRSGGTPSVFINAAWMAPETLANRL
jgi:hypothetical protein